MNVRQLFFASATVAAALLIGCGSSSNRDGANTPNDVSSSANDAAGSDSTAHSNQPDNDMKEMPHGAKSTNEGNSVPEDYALTDRDCVELAKRYKVVQKGDQMATLSPKLTSAQKEQAEKAINEGISQIAENWENGCHSSLVGGVVDRNNLKCAMASKTVKGFDECINGAPPK